MNRINSNNRAFFGVCVYEWYECEVHTKMFERKKTAEINRILLLLFWGRIQAIVHRLWE